MAAPLDAACSRGFGELLGPLEHHAAFLVVSLLGWLLPACIAYHLLGDHVRVLRASKIKLSLIQNALCRAVASHLLPP